MRTQITSDWTDEATSATYKKLYERLKEKGWGSYSGRHEILGILTEEFWELVEAVKSQPISGSKNSVREELIDLAVGAIFGVACIDAGAIEPVIEEQG
jgi:NTP pyrophosphatase (non-canonical NTP hydrolase)